MGITTLTVGAFLAIYTHLTLCQHEESMVRMLKDPICLLNFKSHSLNILDNSFQWIACLPYFPVMLTIKFIHIFQTPLLKLFPSHPNCILQCISLELSILPPLLLRDGQEYIVLLELIAEGFQVQ